MISSLMIRLGTWLSVRGTAIEHKCSPTDAHLWMLAHTVALSRRLPIWPQIDALAASIERAMEVRQPD